mmetsp:Transcript_28024/g.43320  ORF Transcript_28024/g.43320 Transcript_28024/m.43320 type:complete len:638 (-) Transcript_28024:202-2115(-)
MTEDDTTTSSSTASAPISLTSDMLEDDDAASDRILMVPPLMVGLQQKMMYDEKKEDDDVDDDHHRHDCGSLWPAAHHPPAIAAAATADSSTTIVAPRRSRKRRKSVILLFAIVVSILLITYTQTTYLNETYEEIKFQIRFSILVARSIYNIVSVNRRKRAGLKVEATARALQTSSSSSSNSSSIEDSSKRRSSWPDPPLDLFQNSTKLIWAYWHSGEENLTPLCQVSLQSWKAHHPTWQIIILSDETYHHYVPSHHIPSTFNLLKVQFRSDIVRLSVLARYGGAYLDMTTMMFKSLDGIWESELRRVEERGGRNRIFVPTVLELGERPMEEEDDSVVVDDDDALLIAAATDDDCNQQHDEQQQPSSSQQSSSSNAVGLVTNSVILSPQPNNPILLKFLERILLYSENPASTAQELKSRPEFQRVLPYMTNYQRKLGILGKDGTLLYSAHLWIFTDLVVFDREMEAGKYFVDLPALRWTYDFIILPHTLTKFDAANAATAGGGACDSMSKTESSSSSCSSQAAPSTSLQEQLQNERIHSWGTWHILKRALWGMIPWQEFDDPNLTNFLVQDVVMFKTSTDGGTLQVQRTYEEFMNMKNSLGRLYRMAMEGTGMNATLEGARPFGYGAKEACSFEFEVC